VSSTEDDFNGSSDWAAVDDRERSGALGSLVRATGSGHVSLEEFYRWTDDVLAARTRGELALVTARFQATPVPAGRVRRHWFVPFGNRIRRGRFVLARRTRAVVLFGEIHLDLRGATLADHEPVISLTVVIGSLRVLVPSWIHVEVDQSSLFGGRTVTAFGPPPALDRPALHIRMVDVLGSVKVSTDPATWSPVVFPGSA
jgi:Cell wall-active antibiotics response 4TMS YvqF/Domain of unknown function (DUF1707)